MFFCSTLFKMNSLKMYQNVIKCLKWLKIGHPKSGIVVPLRFRWDPNIDRVSPPRPPREANRISFSSLQCLRGDGRPVFGSRNPWESMAPMSEMYGWILNGSWMDPGCTSNGQSEPKNITTPRSPAQPCCNSAPCQPGGEKNHPLLGLINVNVIPTSSIIHDIYIYIWYTSNIVHYFIVFISYIYISNICITSVTSSFPHDIWDHSHGLCRDHHTKVQDLGSQPVFLAVVFSPKKWGDFQENRWNNGDELPGNFRWF